VEVGIMGTLSVQLFGRFLLRHGAEDISYLHAGKLQELFCYLLLKREKALSRETVAGLFWGECTTRQSRKYLRQALWHLQNLLSAASTPGGKQILQADQDSVGIHPESALWLDVAEFERCTFLSQQTPGAELREEQARVLEQAVQLYRGDLLEGCYQDWCLFERERLQNMYLAILDKLMSYCEVRQFYQTGLEHGERILRIDRAHERTHQRMLCLHYFSGNRAAALRQFHRCVKSLSEELDVAPSQKTLTLYEQIRGDRLELVETASQESGVPKKDSEIHDRLSVGEIREHLANFKNALAAIQEQVQNEIKVVESWLTRLPGSRGRPS
jgi:DNA-binding SARP family transcriptional activator